MKRLFLSLIFIIAIYFPILAQVAQFPQVYNNDMGNSSASNLNIRQTASSSGNILIPSGFGIESKIGAVSIATNSNDQYFYNWVQVCLPSTSGSLSYGYIACDEFYARIDPTNNYATVTATSLNIRPTAGSTTQWVTIGGQNASYGQNSIVALTGSTSLVSGVTWYQVYLTTNCSQAIGWLSGQFLSLNSNVSNYRTVGGRICDNASTCSSYGNINGASINISGIGTTHSSGDFYEYKLSIGYTCTITCTHPNYSTPTPSSYNHTANSDNYSRSFVLTNTTSCTTPSNPPNPTQNAVACGAVTLTRQGSVPSNETWYWQNTSCDTRMDLGSGSTFQANTTGTYFIRAYNNNDGGCWSTSCGSINVIVNPGPTVTANSNSPVTAPAPLNLTATNVSGASYSWTGPNGFASNEQNPIRNPTNTTMTGDYCVTATVSGCTSVPSCKSVIVNGTPPPASQIKFITHNERLDDITLSNENTTQSVSSDYLKICADGSKATKVEFTNNNPDIPTSNIKFWIESDPFGNNSEATGYFVNYRVNGNVVTADYQHPLYMNQSGATYKSDAIKAVDYTNESLIFKKPIRIYRAPILFVHGWLGDETTFEYMDNILNEDRYLFSLTHRFNYHDSSKLSFYDNRNIVSNRLTELFQKNRDGKFSSGKAIVIAHSMGGILSRLYLQSGRYKNDICKLITLNTPHSGSQGANFLYNIGNVVCPLSSISWLHWIDFACTPAVENMKVNSFAIRNYLNGSSLNRHVVPSYAISTEDVDAFDTDCYSFGVLLYSGANGSFDQALMQSIFNFETNDIVVPVSSQKGGLTKFDHFTGQCHLGSYKNISIINKVKDLIDLSPNAANFDIDGFEPPTLNSIFLRPIANGNTNRILSGDISITSPSNNAVFNPGQQITIQTTGSSTIQKTVVGIGNAHIPLFAKDVNSNTSSSLYTIPNEAFGEVRIISAGYDTVNKVLIDIDTIRIKVNANSVLDSINSYPEILRIPINNQTSLSLKGYFGDNVVRDISESDSIVFLISDTAIARNVFRNTFLGKNIGTTTLNISFRDKNFQIPIEVYQGDNVVSALFNSTKNTVCLGESVDFSDLSVGGSISRQWYFPGGNPSSSTDINPIITYSDTGHFNVKLIVNFSGLSDTLELTNYISVSNKNTTIKSGNWNSPETWGCLSIPSQNDSAIIAAGDTISLDASQQIKRLYIEPGGSLVINDSSKTLIVGNDTIRTNELLSDGNLKITNGTLKINGKLNIANGSSFEMSGGKLIIDGNTGNESTSVPDGEHLFNVYTSANKFNFSGGTLQIINPPLGANSQTINCSQNFGAATTLMFGDGVSTIASNNPNGFGGNLMPSEIGKIIFDPATSQNNRIFKNLNPLIVRGRCEVRSGNFVQQEYLQILDSITINSGLVARYNFSNNVIDSSGNGNDGTTMNGAVFTNDRFGNPSSAVQLDGIDDYIELPSGNSTSINITADFTVSFWMKTSDNSGNLASIGDNVNVNGGGYLSGINGGNVGDGKIGISTRGDWTGSVNSISDNNWHHVVYSLKNDTLRIYIDDVLDKETIGVLSPLSWNGNRVIGCRNDLIMTAATNYEGKIDDLFIYNRALSQTEINYLYTLRPPRFLLHSKVEF